MFSGKNVLLLGATGGIGSTLAGEISKEGGKLILVARNEDKLLALKDKLSNHAIVKSVDITQFEQMKTVVKESLEAFDQIDVMIHAVGSIILKPLHALKVEEFHETLNLNLVSAFNALKCIVRPMMRKKHGSVVFISSVAGSTGLTNHEAISAAKGGLEAMIRSAAITYAKRGVRINGVALGLVDTPLSKKLTSSQAALEASEKLHPLGRIGEPKDAIPAVLYLASDKSSWVTGTIMHVDGGISAGK